MKRQVCFGLVLAGVVIGVCGCEWTGTSSDEAWNDSMSWVNFSGLYRGSGGTIVRAFNTGTVPVTPTPTPDDGTVVIRVVNNESGGVAPIGETELSGILGNRPGIVPGSVSIVFAATVPNGSSGSVTDNGGGVLSGTFNLVGLDPSDQQPAVGTMNYDTGVWTLRLTSPGLLTTANIRSSYTYDAGVVQISDGGAGGGGDAAATSIVGGVVNSIQVEQLGNKLTFRTSTGHELSGRLSMVTLPGGDRTGRSAGDVTATYQVAGVVSGRKVKINGTLSGVYVPPADIQFANTSVPVIYGILSNRTLQGIWMQPGGTADVFGIAPQQSVPVNVGDFRFPEEEGAVRPNQPIANEQGLPGAT